MKYSEFTEMRHEMKALKHCVHLQESPCVYAIEQPTEHGSTSLIGSGLHPAELFPMYSYKVHSVCWPRLDAFSATTSEALGMISCMQQQCSIKRCSGGEEVSNALQCTLLILATFT